MPSAVACPSCSASFKVRDDLAGRKVVRNHRGGTVTVPAGRAPRTAPPAAALVEPLPEPDPPAPARAAKPCPFCAEPVRPEAKKCRHCGETLDPALRAAEEARRDAKRARRTRRDEDDEEEDEAPARSGFRLFSCGGCLLAALALVGLGVGGYLYVHRQQVQAVNEGTRLWDAGQRDAAVAKYKEGYPGAGDMKASVLRRIVEHEASKGNTAEARKWIERGLDDRLDVAYEGDAGELLAEVKKEREEKAAKKKAEEEARAQARREEQSAPRKGVTRANYERVKEGMTLEEVEAILGKGKEASSAGNLRVMTWQGGVVNLKAISITVEDDRVVAKDILD